MMLYKDFEKRKNMIRDFLVKNPNVTYRQIKKRLHTKIEKVYPGGIKEAFKDAGIKSPRTFDKKTKEEKRKIIIDYIREHPGVGSHIIVKDTKINLSSIFKSVKEAYDLSGIIYPRIGINKSKEDKKREIISLIKKDPLITASDIRKITGINSYKLFNNFDEIYREAGIKKINRSNKKLIKNQNKVIDFIRKNPISTQREINLNCKTHVQDIFKEGIFEAYKLANIPFPYERLRLYGVGLKYIREDAKKFEDEIALKLSGYGKVNRLIKTKRGVADIVFERKDKKIIIEVKNYLKKDISISQINQLNNYLEDFNCNTGVLVCNRKPNKDRFIIGKNSIFILDKEELHKIPSLMEL